MSEPVRPVALHAEQVPPRRTPSLYPAPFAARTAGRTKHPLGDLFGLTNFGVNLTRLAPGAVSALRHAHSRQDEFVYVVRGHPTLETDAGPTRLAPGMVAGFRAGTGDAHRLVNATDEDVVYLEVGDRTPRDTASYPDDDLAAAMIDGRWVFTHKDGMPYPPAPAATGLAPGAGPAAGAVPADAVAVPAPPARPVNRYCPRSGKPVREDALTAYRGHVVGFCNPGCRDDFAAHVDARPEDRRYFDALIREHGLEG